MHAFRNNVTFACCLFLAFLCFFFASTSNSQGLVGEGVFAVSQVTPKEVTPTPTSQFSDRVGAEDYALIESPGTVSWKSPAYLEFLDADYAEMADIAFIGDQTYTIKGTKFSFGVSAPTITVRGILISFNGYNNISGGSSGNLSFEWDLVLGGVPLLPSPRTINCVVDNSIDTDCYDGDFNSTLGAVLTKAILSDPTFGYTFFIKDGDVDLKVSVNQVTLQYSYTEP